MKNKRYLKLFILRVMVSTVIFLIIGIFINSNDKFLLFYKNNVYDKNFDFSFINRFVNKYFGKTFYIDEDVVRVNKEINYTSYNSYKDGVVFNDVVNVYPIKSGIVVYIGDKDEYGHTIIVQGMDGVDYWYSNVLNVAVKLYDYVDTDTLLSNTVDNKLYMLFMCNGEVLSYDDYL